MNLKILSRNAHLYATQRLVEVGLKRGHSVEVIDPIQCNLILEKEGPTVSYNGRRLNTTDAIIPCIDAPLGFYGTAVVRQFEMMNTFTTTTSQALVLNRDKLRSLQILSIHEIGFPRSVFGNYSDNLTEMIDLIGGAPLVIKLLEENQGIEIIPAENRKAAKSIIAAFNSRGIKLVIQEYINENEGSYIRVFALDGNIIGAIKRPNKNDEWESYLNHNKTEEMIALTSEEETTAIQAVQTLRLSIASVDMIRSKRGPLIVNVNVSPGLEGIERATKKDIAVEIIKYIERHK